MYALFLQYFVVQMMCSISIYQHYADATSVI